LSIRERSKQKRRNRILLAARALIVEEGVPGLSMRVLAEKAEVSVATLYNLLGSKEEILYALLDQSYETLDMTATSLTEVDPIIRAQLIVEASVKQFLSDSEFYKRLLRGIHGIERGARASGSVLKVWALAEKAVADGMESGLLRKALPARLIAQQILASYSGAIRNWVIGRMSDDDFKAHAQLGLTLSLLAVATDETRSRLETRAQEIGNQVLNTGATTGSSGGRASGAVA